MEVAYIFLDDLEVVAIFVFVSSSMLAIGLGHTIGLILAPLANFRLLLFTLLANFGILPVGAIAIAVSLQLEKPLADGLVLLGITSGAPFVPKLTEYARGDLRVAVAIMVMLTVGTIVLVPLVLPFVCADVVVSPLTVARPLLWFILLPLAIGLATRACGEYLAARLWPVVDHLSNVTLLPVVVLVSALNIGNILDLFGTRGILAGILLLFFGVVVGWFLGGLLRIHVGQSRSARGCAISRWPQSLRTKASRTQRLRSWSS